MTKISILLGKMMKDFKSQLKRQDEEILEITERTNKLLQDQSDLDEAIDELIIKKRQSTLRLNMILSYFGLEMEVENSDTDNGQDASDLEGSISGEAYSESDEN